MDNIAKVKEGSPIITEPLKRKKLQEIINKNVPIIAGILPTQKRKVLAKDQIKRVAKLTNNKRAFIIEWGHKLSHFDKIILAKKG